jgi:hypothetical protein
MKLTPKNWDNFQHYKHRSPPWIKLHKNLLDDMAFQRLPVASKAIAPMLWLLASESHDGVIHKSPEEIAFRLRMTEKEVISAIKPLIDNGFFIEDSNVLAERLQGATTEKRQSRVETEKETETKTPEGVSDSVFKDYLEVRKTKKAKWTDTALKGLIRESEKAGISLQEAMEICCSRGWVGFNADWVKDQQTTSTSNDKAWMFTDAGVVAKASELGIHSIGLSYKELKDKCLLIMAKRAMQ